MLTVNRKNGETETVLQEPTREDQVRSKPGIDRRPEGQTEQVREMARGEACSVGNPRAL
jgi:hypothetical protein